MPKITSYTEATSLSTNDLLIVVTNPQTNPLTQKVKISTFQISAGAGTLSTDVLLGGNSPSDILYPSQRATKIYTDTTISPVNIKLAGIESGADITSNHTAALIFNQGALATLNSVDFNTQVSGATKPANNATVGATWGTNLGNIPGTLLAPSGTGLFISSTYMGYYKSGIWTNFIKNDGTFGFSGDATNYITWDGHTLNISGTVNITGGSGYANLLDKPTALSQIDSASSTKLGGIATGATVGATWGTNLGNIPISLQAPSGDGLYLSASYMGYYKTSAWKSYIKNDGTFAFAGDVNNYISWNGVTLQVSGSVNITGGSGYANLSDKPTTLSAISSTDGAKLAGVQAGATVGATWGTNLSGIPVSLSAPSGAGLYLSSTYMGYYNGGAYTAYIANNGTFYFGDGGYNYVTWNGATLSVGGSIIATGNIVGNAVTRGGDYYAAASIYVLGTTETIIGSLTLTSNSTADIVYIWAKCRLLTTPTGSKGNTSRQTIIRLRKASNNAILDSWLLLDGEDINPSLPPTILIGIASAGAAGSFVVNFTVQLGANNSEVNICSRYMVGIMRSR